MNTLHKLIFTIFIYALLSVTYARADDVAYAKVLKERDAVLSQILSEREGRVASGVGDEEAVIAARLALFTFRRDTATSKAEKIKQQELIVGIYQKKLATVKSRSAAGLSGLDDILLATDAELQARQVLEELRCDEKKG